MQLNRTPPRDGTETGACRGAGIARAAVGMLMKVTICLGICLPAHAACTRTQNLLANVAIPAVELKVAASAQVGTVIHTVTGTINQTTTSVSCSGGGGVIRSTLVQAEQLIPRPADFIYPTKVAGIGVRVTFKPTGAMYDVPYASQQALGNQSFALGKGSLLIELVKTSMVTGSGPVFATGTFTSYRLDDVPAKPLMTSTVTGTGPVIVKPTCTVDAGSQNIPVDLGTVANTKFTGVGSRQASTPFAISLQCSGASQPGNQSTVSLRLDGSANLGFPGVLNIQNVQGAATKVGIELKHTAQGAETPVTFGQAILLGSTVTGSSALQLPLVARYIQTAAGRVTGGTVQATATFTIQYD